MENIDLNLNQFIENLIAEKKYPNLEAEILAQMKEDLNFRLENLINVTIVNSLPDEKLEEFEELIDKQVGAEEMQKFMSDNISDLPELISKTLLDFRKKYLNL